MAVPGRADMLLAAAGEKGLWRSLDGGLTWEVVPAAGKPVWSVTATPGAQGRVLIAGPQLEWSNDYGVVWHDAGWPEARLVASDPRNAKIFLAVHGGRHDPRLDRRRALVLTCISPSS